MTIAQLETLSKMTDLIREHFDAGVLIVEGEGDEGKTRVEIGYHGGYAHAHGLLQVAQYRILVENENNNPPFSP